MSISNTQRKIAVLIDADNTAHSRLQAILTEISAHGQIIVKRAYGDWSGEHLKNWGESLNELAILPIQQPAYTKGKNSCDIALVIDAMDLLYSNRINLFAIVSSDSDFTRLASRLRESDTHVLGIGKEQTPRAFKNACNSFILVENLTGANEEKAVQKKRSPTEAFPLLKQAWEQHQDEDGWAPVPPAGSFIKGHSPDFDTRTYGAQKLTDLIRKLAGHLELREQNTGSHKHFWYRPKSRKQPAPAKVDAPALVSK